MLDGNPHITQIEHRYFFATASTGLLVRLLELFLGMIFFVPKEGSSFAIYNIFDHWDLISPLYCFVGFLLIIPPLIKIKIETFFLSAVPLVLLTYFFDNWFVDTQLLIQRAAEVNPNFTFKTWDHFLLGGSATDVFTFLLVNILVLWQASMIFRTIKDQPK